MNNVIQWLLESDEPWTRYRALVDLLDRPASDADVQAARAGMLAHPLVQGLIAQCAAWGDAPFKRHNDASYPIYALSTLADFGVKANDPGMGQGIGRVLAHQSVEGAFQSVVNIPKSFGGTGEDLWTWIVCDAPTLLYALLSMGLQDDARVQRAVAHLVGLVDEVGWRCKAAPELGKFKGPGKGSDPCPIANVYALKAISLLPELCDGKAAHRGAEMLLGHWAARGEKKYFLFGVGSDFRKLKYPFVWYDILHVVDVLSRFSFAHADPRFKEMAGALVDQADENGRYTAASMYQAWKGWSFADKKQPSPWLTCLVLCIQQRIERKKSS
ncbi:MAG: hypothetical protein JW934_12235 [Anaerolineae bacterium]|nr:hypothetical protein [Anaerolineae bacterium]